MIFGVTKQGFVKKRIENIISSLENNMRSKGYEDFKINPYSVEGVFLGAIASEISYAWEGLEETYSSRYFDMCVGVQLDRHGKNLNTPRILGKNATTTLKFIVDADVIIPKDTYVKIPGTDYNYSTISELKISKISGFGEVQAIAEKTGSGYNASNNTITEMVNSVIGVVSVTNVIPATGGEGVESDDTYRNALKTANKSKGGSTVDSITAALRKVKGVNNVLVLENIKDTVDENGIAPGAYKCFIDGIATEDIAKTIHKYGPLGIRTEGNLNYKVENDGGQLVDVKYSLFTKKKLYININITSATKDTELMKDKIKESITQYVEFANFSELKKIVHNQIEAKAYNVEPGSILQLEATMGEDKFNLSKENINVATGVLYYPEIEVM
ncbi:MAG: baseplate J/gp47 family protein [Cetobacterium sp.]|uniref:baseplate J/gp47 family protein n=1 Tax=Cetobacterium sp. TaxID=2071632 RepID=UPI002FC9413F